MFHTDGSHFQWSNPFIWCSTQIRPDCSAQEGPLAKYFICASNQRCRSSQHMPHDLVAGTGSKRAHAAATWRTKERRKDAQWHFGKFSAQTSPPFFFPISAKRKKSAKTATTPAPFPSLPPLFYSPYLSHLFLLFLSANLKTLTLERKLSLTFFFSLCKSQNPNPRKDTLSLICRL